MSDTDPFEAKACLLTSSILDVERCEHWDRNGRQNAFDFKLYISDQVHALEVTTATHEEIRDHQARWNTYGPSPSTTYPGLQGHWEVMVDQRASTLVRKQGRKRHYFNDLLPQWLKIFEQHGIDEAGQFSTTFKDWPFPSMRPDQPSESPALRKAIFESAKAGIWTCKRVYGVPPGVSFAYGYGSSDYGLTRPADDPNHAVHQISDLLRRKSDNAEKLGASGCDRRHLWVWVDLSRLDIIRSLDEDGGPTEVPAVDSRITDVWIARLLEDARVDALHWRTDDGWGQTIRFDRYVA
ncbi:hypothetical protein [Glycomyces xiaoerkulensis]|uniref:hypothetical protein n=1 Tax=Glycomyces xiaoerkulensis TaxID=2038139 RepID=UPI000C26343D|nr:hypothetical protein [Glycomyces xiaoerkulensis]